MFLLVYLSVFKRPLGQCIKDKKNGYVQISDFGLCNIFQTHWLVHLPPNYDPIVVCLCCLPENTSWLTQSNSNQASVPNPPNKADLGSSEQTGRDIRAYYLHKSPGPKSCAYKHKTINLTRWEKDPLQSTSKSAEQTKKNKTMIVSKITVLVFWSFSKGMGRTIWFSNRNFRFSQCKW